MESDDEGIADLKVEDFMNARGRRLQTNDDRGLELFEGLEEHQVYELREIAESYLDLFEETGGFKDYDEAQYRMYLSLESSLNDIKPGTTLEWLTNDDLVHALNIEPELVKQEGSGLDSLSPSEYEELMYLAFEYARLYSISGGKLEFLDLHDLQTF